MFSGLGEFAPLGLGKRNPPPDVVDVVPQDIALVDDVQKFFDFNGSFPPSWCN